MRWTGKLFALLGNLVRSTEVIKTSRRIVLVRDGKTIYKGYEADAPPEVRAELERERAEIEKFYRGFGDF